MMVKYNKTEKKVSHIEYEVRYYKHMDTIGITRETQKG